MIIPESWRPYLEAELSKPYIRELAQKVEQAGKEGPVYPPDDRVFAALAYTAPQDIKAVILGQDPYHEAGQAMGLSFSVPEGTKMPPSLRNMFRELRDDTGIFNTVPDLTPWAKQGVLLLNTVLTVSDGKANSHAGFGWERFTDAVLDVCAAMPQPVAFVLWGAPAQKKAPRLKREAPTLVLKSAHPSPLSAYRGFFGSRPYSAVNRFLAENGVKEIDWRTGPLIPDP